MDIDITPLGDGQFKAKVIASPRGGDGENSFSLPFSRDHWDGWKIQNQFNEQLAPVALDPGPLHEKSRSQVGELLFSSLLSGSLKDVWLANAQALGDDQRLALRLRLNETDLQLAAFSELPWEMIQPPGQRPLVLSGNHSLVRLSQHLDPPQSLDLPDPLEVLAVLPMPSDMEQWGRAAFAESISLPGENQRVRVTILPGPVTLSNLRKYVLAHPVNILHFTGHGGKEGSNWHLAFENDQGLKDLVDGESLAINLASINDLRLVSLFSCNTSRAPGGANLGPFAGIAQSLTAVNIPAVLAMQAALTIKAAPMLANLFYARLALGDSVDEALEEARRHLFNHTRQHGLAWATPVLYLRTPHSHLFEQPKFQEVYLNSYTTLSFERKRELTGPAAHWLCDFSPNFLGEGSKRRRVRYPEAWPEMLKELENLKLDLVPEIPVLVQATCTLPLILAAGRVLNQAAGFNLIFRQKNRKTGQLEAWSTQNKRAPLLPGYHLLPGNGGEDLVVTLRISPSQGMEDQVSHYLRATHVNYANYLQLRLDLDPSKDVIEDSDHALGLAMGMADKIREHQPRGVGKTHLFMAGPAGFFLLLGWYLGSSGAIQTYEYHGSDCSSSVFLPGVG